MKAPYLLPPKSVEEYHKDRFNMFLRKLLLLLLLFPFFSVHGQNRATVTGTIVDSLSGTTLSKATVAIVRSKDSSLLAYTLTDPSGKFTLHNLPQNQNLRIIVTFVARQTFRKNILIGNSETLNIGTINLLEKNIGLSEVIVKADRIPVVINKDTIEFAAEAFKVRPNAVVEDLLTRLPGLQVNGDGTILVNGKSVSKIMLNGHEYFSNDARIATKNIDASMIDKVQIYDDRDNDPDHLISEANVAKIINLKFKKIYKQSFFGKVYGGIGTDHRYEAGGLLNSLRDTLQISLIGFGNNLSRTAFSRGDLSSLGGFNRGGDDQLNTGNVALGGRATNGIEKVGATGVNINNDYGKELKINFLFFLNHTTDTYKTTSLNTNFLNDTTLYASEYNQRNQGLTSYNLSAVVESNPSKSVRLRYSPHLQLNSSNVNNEIFANQSSNFNPAINNERDTINTITSGNVFDHSLSFYKKFTKGASLTLTNSLLINGDLEKRFLNNNLTNFTEIPGTVSANQLNKVQLNNHVINTELSVRYPVSKIITASVMFGSAYSGTSQSVLAFKRDSQSLGDTSSLSEQSGDIHRSIWTETVKPGLTIQLSKSASLTTQLSTQIQNTDINVVPHHSDIDTYLLPSISFQSDKISVSVNETISQPSILDLNPVIIKSNSYNSFQGNPLLTPSKRITGTISYYTYNPESNSSWYILATGTVNENPVYYKVAYNTLGYQFSSPVNGDYSRNAYIGMNITKRFKEVNGWTTSLKSSLNLGVSSNIVSINNENGTLLYHYAIASTEFLIRYKDILEFGPHYDIAPAISTYQHIPYHNVTNVTQKAALKYLIRFSNSWSLEGDYTNFYNSQISNEFQRSNNLLNAAIAFQMQKDDRGQLKLSAFDLLNQNISVFRSARGNGIYQGENLIQKRYFMLTYQYKLLNPHKK